MPALRPYAEKDWTQFLQLDLETAIDALGESSEEERRSLRERWTVFGEVRDWIATDGSDFAGNVLRYGVGVGYDVYRSCTWRITPVLEGVGWTVLSGKDVLLLTAFEGEEELSRPFSYNLEFLSEKTDVARKDVLFLGSRPLWL